MKLPEGIHAGIPMEDYLSDCTPGPGVQSTNLKHLASRCPKYAFARWSGNAARIQDRSTDATEFGTAAHKYIVEGPDEFAKRYVVKPLGHDGRTKEGKAWLAANAGKDYVSDADMEALRRMADMIKVHPTAGLALRSGTAEVTAIVQDKETGLWLKCRPDYLTPRLAIDLKTTENNGVEAFGAQAWKLKYHLSAAMTLDVLQQLGQPVAFAFLSVEKAQPYVPALRALSERFLLAGQLLYRRSLRRFADCLSSGKWSGYSDEVETIGVTAWQDKEIDMLIQEAA